MTSNFKKLGRILPGLIIIGIMIILAFYITYEIFSNDDFCVKKGFDTSGDQTHVEEGYIACCNHVYKDNIQIQSECKGVRK